MRLIAVSMGNEDSKVRNAEITEMLNYGFAQYKVDILINKNTVIGKKEINKAKIKNIELVPKEDVILLTKKTEEKKNITYEIKVDTIKAPIKIGDPIGKLLVKEKNEIILEMDVTVKEEVKKANILQLYKRYLKDIIVGN